MTNEELKRTLWDTANKLRGSVSAAEVLLAKHKYPPDAQPDATEKVIAQAELLADGWAMQSG